VKEDFMQWIMTRTEKDPNYVNPYSHPWKAGAWEAWEYLYNENERLRRKIDQISDEKRQAIDLMQAEIERLRAVSKFRGEHLAIASAEIERLREENENYLLELRMSSGSVEEIAKMANEKYEEVERLRGLLREARDNLAHTRGWECGDHVREALGEVGAKALADAKEEISQLRDEIERLRNPAQQRWEGTK
jgi:uncharacterized protein YukE